MIINNKKTKKIRTKKQKKFSINNKKNKNKKTKQKKKI